MRIISRKRLAEFWTTRKEAKTPLDAWYKIAIKADWASLTETRRSFPHADDIKLACGLNVTIFNAGGNKFRIVTILIYPYRRIYIKMVLTHKEYDTNQWKAELCREYNPK